MRILGIAPNMIQSSKIISEQSTDEWNRDDMIISQAKLGLLVMLIFGFGITQPLLAVTELSQDELSMKDRLVALSQKTSSLDDLKIEFFDGSGMSPDLKIYNIMKGKISAQHWTLRFGSQAKIHERAMTDDELRNLLRELIEKRYWTFKGTRFTPDAPLFLFRFHYKGLNPVDYHCEDDEYRKSKELSSIRDLFLRFVSDEK